MKFLRFFFLFLIIGILIFLANAYQQGQKSLTTPLKAGVLHVPKGANIGSIAAELQAKHGLAHPKALEIYARLQGKASKIKAGDYQITAQTTAQTLLEDLVAGKVIVLQIRIVEGKTFRDLRTLLDKTPNIIHETKGKSEAEIAEMLKIKGSLEGQFLPDTYNYNYQDTDSAILKRMHAALEQELNRAWENRSPDAAILNNAYEALILASIIEKETAIASEREAISGVFHRRLQQNMRLQTDPSVIYGLGDKYTGKLSKSDLQTDSPYNTYTRYGLPPSPIALPSKASILAATQPEASENLYFVADGSGGHKFSKTYSEHQEAVRNWRKIELGQEEQNPIIVKPAVNQRPASPAVIKNTPQTFSPEEEEAAMQREAEELSKQEAN